MLLVLAFLFPMAAGAIVAWLRRSAILKSDYWYAGTALVTDVLCIIAACFGKKITVFSLGDTVSMTFELDPLGILYLMVVLILYTATVFYSLVYMTHLKYQPLFYGFYFLSMGFLIALCMAANLVTMYMCFEFVTLSTFSLVLHDRTKEAVTAGLKYLFYSMAGALMGLMTLFYMYFFSSGDHHFVLGGFLDPEKLAGHEALLPIFAMIGILGFGAKAGLFPLHGWLPTAHPIAPAPASALMSGIIAKAGVLAIIRLVYYSIGPELLAGTWAQYLWMGIASLTVVMGSTMAFLEKNFKKRLAYSTVSQISYIQLGLSVLSLDGLRGALIHLMQHAPSKACLFLAAGIFIYMFHRRNVSDIRGLGRRMPVTFWCITFAALSLVGIPPMGGFLSKWEIAGALVSYLNGGVFRFLGPVVLLISALLTAGYLLPIVVDGFFPKKEYEEPEEIDGVEVKDPSKNMLVPMILLCCMSLCAGLFGNSIVDYVLGGL